MVDNEVFEFRCSQGLLFDVSRQVCDFKANVDNCDVMSGMHDLKFLLMVTLYRFHMKPWRVKVAQNENRN